MDDEPRNIFKRWLGGMSEQKIKPESLYPHELRAFNMQVDMKAMLQQAFPRPPDRKYIPIQWAVRTSMDEIQTAGILNVDIEELGDKQLHQLSQVTGKSPEELRSLFREKGDKLDIRSITNAYTVVEWNIQHALFERPYQPALAFLSILDAAVQTHRPDSQKIHGDPVVYLANGNTPKDESALFEGSFFFQVK